MKFTKKKIVIAVIIVLAVIAASEGIFLIYLIAPVAESCNVRGIKLHGFLWTYRTDMLEGLNDTSSQEDVFDNDISSSEQIVQAIEEANQSYLIKAILLEIDSGGGSIVAGEEIAEALKRAGKPTVVLIREGGASAAYLAASGAQYIIASSNSDVGGIGITMSYLDNYNKNIKDGLTYNQLSIGKFKDSGDPDKPLTAEEKELFMRDLKISYGNVMKTIAENRGLDVKKTEQLADGSTMLGQMAKDNGLIDELGSIYTATDYLSQQIGEEASICW